MKRRILSFVLTLILCTFFSATAMASGFDAGLTVDRTNEKNGSFTVVVVSNEANNSILENKKPLLSVICNYLYAKVIGPDGSEIASKISDGEISFRVTKGGTYTVTELDEVEEQKPVTITFDSGCGSAVAPQTVLPGETAVQPVFPTREHYTFTGWYSDAELTETYDFGTPVTSDITLYAKWTAKRYTITFDTNGGSKIDPITQAYGTPVTPPEDPTRRGYDFLGWDTEIPETMPDKDLVITATWDKIVYEPYIPPTSTEVTKNEDGSTTTTVTNNRTGTVIETTEQIDGSVVTAETKKNGTVTETVENTDGSTITTVTKIDGSSVAITELADGTTATITTDEKGNTETEVEISKDAVATEAVVSLPIPAVERTDDHENAAVITVSTNSIENVAVAIPVVEVSAATVAVLVNEDGTETVNSRTKMSEDGLVLDVPDGTVVKIIDKVVEFADVSETDWEQEAVQFAAARGLVNGVGSNSFDLDSNTTRAHVVTLLARLAGVDTRPEEGQMWYDKGEAWAVANSITYAGNMNEAITRHEVMTFLWRYMGSPASNQDLSYFTDAHELNEVTTPAAQWAVEIGLVRGHGNGTMTPTANVTRGQLAQFMMNFIQLT